MDVRDEQIPTSLKFYCLLFYFECFGVKYFFEGKYPCEKYDIGGIFAGLLGENNLVTQIFQYNMMLIVKMLGDRLE